MSYPNGTKTEYSYFDTNRIKDITNKAGETIFSSYSYDYDTNGNRTNQTELQNGLTWTTTYGVNGIGGYDRLDRLLSYTVESGVTKTTTSYSYEGDQGGQV